MKKVMLFITIGFLSPIVQAQWGSVPELKSYSILEVSPVKAKCDAETEPKLLLPGCFLKLKEFSKSGSGAALKVYANTELCSFKVGDRVDLSYRSADCDVSFGLRCRDYKNERVEFKRKDEYFACVVKHRDLVDAYKANAGKKSVIRFYNEEKMSFEDVAPKE